MTLQELLLATTRTLQQSGVTESAALDARLILQKALGYDETGLILSRFSPVPSSGEQEVHTLLEQRLSSRPMAYILGHKGFYDLDFLVDERVLIPQPDTETLVDDVLRTTRKNEHLTLLDMCTGSGCIGITLARHLGCHLVMADLSDDALKVAEANANRWLEKGQFELVHSDLFENIHGTFDLIVSNPPYLTRGWIQEASKEVQCEPDMALDGKGEDGLSLMRTLIAGSRSHLSPHGRIWLECDYRQSLVVKELLLANGCVSVYIEKDLAGKDRVVVGATDHVRATD